MALAATPSLADENQAGADTARRCSVAQAEDPRVRPRTEHELGPSQIPIMRIASSRKHGGGV